MRLSWVDPIKGIAIILVVGYHTTGPLKLPNFAQGQLGVDIFMLVSGYTLALNLRDESPCSFYRRRLLRILPAYWIAILITAVTLARFDMPPDFKGTLLQVALLHVYRDAYFFTTLNAWWFVGAIAFLYLIFPAIAGFVRQGRVNTVVLIGLIIALAWFLKIWLGHLPYPANPVFSHFVWRIPAFFIGVALAIWQRGNADVRTDALPLALLCVGLLGWTITIGRLDHMVMWPAMGLVYCWVAYTLVQGLTMLPLIHSGLAWIGALSYEIFLIHDLYLTRLHHVTVKALQPYTGSVSPYVAVFLALAMTVLVSLGIRWAAGFVNSAFDRDRRQTPATTSA
jgi:peptidoglycan/LPS O-acetylase OafA/YrhL